MPLDFKFFIWKFQISITALIFYSSLIGGAIVKTTADLVKVTIEEVDDFTVALEKRVGEIASGAIEAATEVGGDVSMTIKATVYGIVKAGSDVKELSSSSGNAPS